MSFSARRIGAMIWRYLYLLQGSWLRIVELAYWPTVQMLLWGFFAQYIATATSGPLARAAGVLVAGVLLWDVLFRSQIGLSVVFFEELYSRNLGHLCVSPLRPHELIVSLVVISLLRTLVGVGLASLLALPVFGFRLTDLGLPLLGFFASLMMFGWAMGLMVAALVLRNGLGAESIAWAAVFALAPVSGIYYPVATLPEWLQPLSWALPSSHVFEGMRAVLLDQRFDAGHMVRGLALNVLYLALGAALFLATFRTARRRGLLLQSSE